MKNCLNNNYLNFSYLVYGSVFAGVLYLWYKTLCTEEVAKQEKELSDTENPRYFPFQSPSPFSSRSSSPLSRSPSLSPLREADNNQFFLYQSPKETKENLIGILGDFAYIIKEFEDKYKANIRAITGLYNLSLREQEAINKIDILDKFILKFKSIIQEHKEDFITRLESEISIFKEDWKNNNEVLTSIDGLSDEDTESLLDNIVIVEALSSELNIAIQNIVANARSCIHP